MDRAQRIRASFEPLAPRADALVEAFYVNLFSAAPAARALFPKDMAAQRQHLAAALALVVKHADQLESLAPALRAMGARHVGYGATPAHYGLVRDVLIGTLAEHAGAAWSEQLSSDWRAALDAVAGMMLDGARAAESAA